MNSKICKMIIIVCLFTALSSCNNVNNNPKPALEDIPKVTQAGIESQENLNDVSIQQTDEELPQSQETIEPSKTNTPTNGMIPVNIDPIIVPSGLPPIIDGTLSTGEWDDAAAKAFADDSQLFLMREEDYLYLGIRTQEQRSFAGNVYFLRDEKIFVLHSSAALGTAIYEKADNGWEQIQDFIWQLRDTSISESAQAKRAEFLLTEGWLASNGNMGTSNELEYQIKIQEDQLQIAVVFTKSTSPYEKVPWPSQLDDDTITPTPGGFPTMMDFSPTRWGLFEFE